MVDHPPDSSDHPQWYVALVRSGREQFAKEHLLASGFDEAFYPRRRHTRTVRGRSFEVLLPHFNGYVFCRTFAFTAFIWHLAVRATEVNHPQRGLVRSFSGGWPAAPVTLESIEDVRSCCDVEGIVIPALDPGPSLFAPGTLVRILDDIYDGQTFVVVWDNGAKGINVRALQGAQFLLYIRERERVSSLLQVEPASSRSLTRTGKTKDRAPRLAKRMRRGFRAGLQSA